MIGRLDRIRRRADAHLPPSTEQSCGQCLRWRRLPNPGSRYGNCRWPGVGPEPYWRAQHPTGDIMVADIHGRDCAAFKRRRDR